MDSHLSKRAPLRALLAMAALSLGLVLPGIAAGDTNPSDSQVTARVKEALAAVGSLKGANIGVKTADGVVTLSGTVSDPHAKFAAVAAVIKVEGVRILDDELKTPSELQKPAGTGAAKPAVWRPVRDDKITTDVKQVLASSLPNRYKLDVKTTDGVVHLRGDLKDQDAIARIKGLVAQVDGVKRVDTSELDAPFVAIAY